MFDFRNTEDIRQRVESIKQINDIYEQCIYVDGICQSFVEYCAQHLDGMLGDSAREICKIWREDDAK